MGEIENTCPARPYSVLMIDPPWNKKKGGLRKVAPRQTRQLDYKTMGTGEIFELLDREIFPLTAPAHIVFLWTVEEFLQEAEREMEKRNYKRHVRIIWDKENGVAPAFSIRYAHEYMIWYYKGPFMNVEKNMRGKYTSVIRERGREHSRKPAAAYKFIEDCFKSYMPFLDVFSREERENWISWGDQTTYFNIEEKQEV